MLFRRISDWPSYGLRSPFRELAQIRRDIDLLSEGFGGDILREPGAGVFPLMNITENGDSYVVRAELPGMKADDIDISITHDTFSISGERKIADEDKDAKYHRKEREGGNFSRVVSMPGRVNPEKAKATSADGVLTVVLPKAEETKPKKITIQSK